MATEVVQEAFGCIWAHLPFPGFVSIESSGGYGSLATPQSRGSCWCYRLLCAARRSPGLLITKADCQCSLLVTHYSLTQ